MLVISAGPKPGESRETEEETQRTKACDHRDRDWTMWPQPRTLGVGEAGGTLLGCSSSTAVGAGVCSLSCALVTLVATQEHTRLGLMEMGAHGLPAPRVPAEGIWAPKYPG